jgi:fibronectin type 3 domain-containing protein
MFQRIWAGLLVVGLLFAVPGCDSGGANGDEDDGGDHTVVPAAPSGLDATSADGEVSLSWEAADDAETYNVYRDTESGVDASGSPLDESIEETSYVDESAENGTEYFYVVTGVADEEGDPSGEAEGVPFAPANGLEGTSGDSQVELSWEAGAGADTYNMYRDTTSGVSLDEDPLVESVGETTYTDQTAKNGTKYYYVVTSVNPNDEESPASNEVEKTPFSDPPDRP